MWSRYLTPQVPPRSDLRVLRCHRALPGKRCAVEPADASCKEGRCAIVGDPYRFLAESLCASPVRATQPSGTRGRDRGPSPGLLQSARWSHESQKGLWTKVAAACQERAQESRMVP